MERQEPKRASGKLRTARHPCALAFNPLYDMRIGKSVNLMPLQIPRSYGAIRRTACDKAGLDPVLCARVLNLLLGLGGAISQNDDLVLLERVGQLRSVADHEGILLILVDLPGIRSVLYPQSAAPAGSAAIFLHMGSELSQRSPGRLCSTGSRIPVSLQRSRFSSDPSFPGRLFGDRQHHLLVGLVSMASIAVASVATGSVPAIIMPHSTGVPKRGPSPSWITRPSITVTVGRISLKKSTRK